MSTTPEKNSPGINPPEMNPIDTHAPQILRQKQIAGGLPAVFSSMNHIVGEVGPVRGMKELFHLNQMGGFDCPGCAWPDPDDKRALTEFCENGAKAVAEEATTKRVDADFFRRHSVAELSSMTDYEIGKEGRLTEPMILNENATHYQPISWDQAFKEIAHELNSLDRPDEAIFYTSGRTSNEAAFLYQLFARIYGTNNLPDCSNMCHESSGVALKDTLGIGKGSVKLEDFDSADCILIIGQNPGTNHPRMLTALLAATRNGCKIISINPLFETGVKSFVHPQEFWRWFGRGTPIATLHLPIRINSDIAVLQGIMKEMLEAEQQTPGSVFDRAFIERYTLGFAEFVENIRSASWETILEQTGLSRKIIKSAADIIIRSKRMIACWAMGLTQQQYACESIEEVVNLLMLGGHLGREGAGVCPVRGHSNVQGDRTMGIFEKPSDEFLSALKKEFNFSPPTHHGWDVVESIKSMHAGKAKVFFGMGGNFLSSTPDTEFTAQALRKCRLTVQVSTKLNRGHLVHGSRALILPCLGRTEIDIQETGPQFVSVENSMGVVSSSRGNLRPLTDQQRSEVAIVSGLALATFNNNPEKLKIADWKKLSGNYDCIRNHVANVVPGFRDFNEKIKSPAGFYLPHGVRDRLEFDTPDKKALFKSFKIPKVELDDGQLMMMTIRSHDQFNTTIYGLHDRYRGVHNGRRVIFLNKQDIQELGFNNKDWVDITSHFGSETRESESYMIVEYDIPKRCAAAYFPETNVLVPIQSVAGRSHTPTYKTIKVSLKPSAAVLS